MRAVWHFRYFETQYRQFRALVIIDSSWNCYAGEWRNYTRYKLLSAQPADTSIFGNAFDPHTSLPYALKDDGQLLMET